MRLWLRDSRLAAGLSQQQLAKKLNKNITTIGKWEKGIRTPKPKTAKQLGALLGFNWERFYEND